MSCRRNQTSTNFRTSIVQSKRKPFALTLTTLNEVNNNLSLLLLLAVTENRGYGHNAILKNDEKLSNAVCLRLYGTKRTEIIIGAKMFSPSSRLINFDCSKAQIYRVFIAATQTANRRYIFVRITYECVSSLFAN